jgi:hypothetical protein
LSTGIGTKSHRQRISLSCERMKRMEYCWLATQGLAGRRGSEPCAAPSPCRRGSPAIGVLSALLAAELVVRLA